MSPSVVRPESPSTLGRSSMIQTAPPGPAASPQNGAADLRPSIRDSLRELASDALSLVDARRTIHPDYEPLLGCIDFRGRSVLDLGCRAGDVSRWVHERGASVVDGVDEDEAAVAAARL